MPRRKKCKVFVSYSRHDEVLVKPLAGMLGAAADDAVFMDVTSLQPGDIWQDEIHDAIRESKVFVVCWCCESKKSEFIAREIGIALRDQQKRIVPVLFCKTPLPPTLKHRQWIDLQERIKHDCQPPHTSDATEEPTDGRPTWQSPRKSTEYWRDYEHERLRPYTDGGDRLAPPALSPRSLPPPRAAASPKESALPPAVPMIPHGNHGYLRKIIIFIVWGAVFGLILWGVSNISRSFLFRGILYIAYLIALVALIIIMSRFVRLYKRRRAQEAQRGIDEIASRARQYFEGLNNS